MARGAPIHRLALVAQPLRASAPVLRVRWNEMLAWSETIHDSHNVVGLHNMRIAAKRLRYTLEIFEPVLPAESADLLKTIAGIQERIGAIHDCDVLFPLLHRTLAQEMKQERKSLHVEHDAAAPPPFLAAEGLVAHMTRKRVERETLYTEFLQFWDALPPERLGTALEHVIESVVGDRE